MIQELSIDELASRTGESVDTLRQWGELGLIGPDARGALGPKDVERVRMTQMLLRRGLTLDALANAARSGQLSRWLDPYLTARFEEAGPPVCTLSDAATRVGLTLELAQRLWAVMSMGDPVQLLHEEDLEIFRVSKTALDIGFPAEALIQLCRVYADTLARAADATNRLFHLHMHHPLKTSGVSQGELLRMEQMTSRRLRPLEEPVLRYFHRRGELRAEREAVLMHLAEEMGVPHMAEAPGAVLAAILFVDMAGFTSLAEAMGDLKAAEVLERFGVIVREAEHCWGGRVVKQIGDAFMLVFVDPCSAVSCAVDIEARIAQEPNFPAVRSGVHWGPVLYREGDYVGSTVNLAARVAAQAQRHQVLMTAAVRKEAGGLSGIEFVRFGKRRLKGIAEELELFEARAVAAPRLDRIIDPVCGMEMAPAEVAVRLTLEGRERGFCSEDCLRRFVGSPERYVT